VEHLDPTEVNTGSGHGVKAPHWLHSPLNRAMILFNAIVQGSTLSDPDRRQLAPQLILEPTCRVTGQDGLSISLAADDHDPLGPAVSLEGLAQETLGCGEVSALAELELNGVAIAVDCTIKMPLLTTHFDGRFIQMPFAGNQPLAPVELLQQKRRITDRPMMDDGVVDRDATLGHHFLEISQAQIVS